jgi:hypothetical protein
MLGYGYNIVGVKLLSMCDGGVITCRLETAFFHEQFTVAHDHMHRMMFADVCDDDDRMAVPMVLIRTDMSSYVVADNLDELGLAGIELVLPEPHVEAPGRTATLAKEVPVAEVVDAVESSTSTPK